LPPTQGQRWKNADSRSGSSQNSEHQLLVASAVVLSPHWKRGYADTGGIRTFLSPSVFRDGEFRFFFFSREKSRIHVHVTHPDGEVNF
jgi:hypothetical protein